MKKSKFILSALLAGYLATTSCTETRDPSKGIEYRFSPEVVFPPDVPSGKNQVLHIKLKSDVYRDGVLEHTVTYTDNKNSFLISPKGDTIKSNETFNISNLNKLNTFNFYSEDLGKHKLKFTFKNSMEFTVDKEHNVSVEEGAFKFSLNPLYQEVTIDTPLEIEYSHEAYDQLKHNYQLKFEENKSHNATLNGHKAGEWFDVSEISGKLAYTPLTPGLHNVKIISKNDKGVEREFLFTLSCVGAGVPIIRNAHAHVFIMGRVSRYKELLQLRLRGVYFSLNAFSGNDEPFDIEVRLKGARALENLVIYQTKTTSPNCRKTFYIPGRNLDTKFGRIKKKKHTLKLEVEITNSYGIKTKYERIISNEDLEIYYEELPW